MTLFRVLWISIALILAPAVGAESAADSANGDWLIPLNMAGEPSIVGEGDFDFQYRTKPMTGYLLHVEVLHPTFISNYVLDLRTGKSTALGDGRMSFRDSGRSISVIGRSAFLKGGGRFLYDLIIDLEGVPLAVSSGNGSNCRSAKEFPNPLRELIEEAGYESFCES